MSQKIKSIKATRYDQKLDSILDTEFTTVASPLSRKEYDMDGHLIQQSTWTTGGAISEKFVFEYQGELLKKRYIYSDEEEIAETESYTYDESGKVISTTLEYLDGSRDITTHSYNNEGQKISSITVDEDGEVGQQEFWEYENGRLTSYQLINDFGEVEIDQKMQYNEQGKALRKDYLNTLEENEYYIVFEYDDKGQLILESKFNTNNKLTEEHSFEYNENGKVILEKTENAKETLVKESQYDAAGNEVYHIEKEEDEEVVNYEVWREFDTKNNQTKSRVLVYGNGLGTDLEYEVKYEYLYWE